LTSGAGRGARHAPFVGLSPKAPTAINRVTDVRVQVQGGLGRHQHAFGIVAMTHLPSHRTTSGREQALDLEEVLASRTASARSGIV